MCGALYDSVFSTDSGFMRAFCIRKAFKRDHQWDDVSRNWSILSGPSFSLRQMQQTPKDSTTSKLYIRLTAVLFATVTILVFLTFRHYGLSWDEYLQYNYGND